MKEISILIGGKAGDGIRQAGHTLARLLNRIGYRIFFYDDYPSLIRGGHNFSIIRASQKRIIAHKETVDLIVALNQDAVEKHIHRLNDNGMILFDTKKAGAQGIGVDFMGIVKDLEGVPIMRNTAAIGALMIGRGTITKRGVLSPVRDIPFAPFTKELEKRGIRVTTRLM